MLFHVPDRSFKRIATALKRARHFATDSSAATDEQHKLEIAFSSMKAFWPAGDDYDEQLALLDWLCMRINDFCDNNQVANDPVARRVMHQLLAGDYVWADFDKLAAAYAVNHQEAA